MFVWRERKGKFLGRARELRPLNGNPTSGKAPGSSVEGATLLLHRTNAPTTEGKRDLCCVLWAVSACLFAWKIALHDADFIELSSWFIAYRSIGHGCWGSFS